MMSSREILETAQSPNSSFPFLFDFGLGLGTWTRACQFNNVKFNIIGSVGAGGEVVIR